jgi:ATP-dependent DNA helicase PIF1
MSSFVDSNTKSVLLTRTSSSVPIIPYDSLSPDQKLALLRFQQKKNIFLTGPGGTGKTRFIQFLAQYMSSVNIPFQVCAMTGCAAVLLNCGAKTLHSWSSIRMARGSNESIKSRVLRNRNAVKTWKSVSVLIIDEVSMMSAKMFDLLNEIGQAARRSSLPFGGIQVMLTGDFFQLPPIGNSIEDPGSAMFCFESPKWSAIFPANQCIVLSTMFRQQDPEFTRILLEIRRGICSEESRATLQKYVHRVHADDALVPTKIFPVKARVDYTNQTMYDAIDSEEKEYTCRVEINMTTYLDTGTAIENYVLESSAFLTPEDVSFEVSRLIDGMQVASAVKLKVGTVVMCTANIDVEHGICNGSQGVVIGFVALPARNELPLVFADLAEYLVPLVRFATGQTRRIDFLARQSEEYPTIVVAQIPLRMAWALTIHKMQGATLDMAEMDIGKSVFEFGQTYVALSRVRSLQGLYLTEFWPHKIKAHPLVIAFYDGLPTLTTEEIGGILDRESMAKVGEYPGVPPLSLSLASSKWTLGKRVEGRPTMDDQIAAQFGRGSGMKINKIN